MKAIILSMLYQVAKYLIGSVDWAKILTAVETLLMDSTLTGDQKKTQVIVLLKSDGVAIGKSLLNFAIEAALQYLKAKA